MILKRSDNSIWTKNDKSGQSILCMICYFNYIENCFITEHMIYSGICPTSTWKECMSYSCWVVYSIYVNAFLVFLLIIILVFIVSYWEWGVEISSNYYQIFSFLFVSSIFVSRSLTHFLAVYTFTIILYSYNCYINY